MDERRQRRRAVVASTIGTTIEWYDFFLYGTAAALVFPQLFFPGSSHLAGVLASFSTLFVGFAARPVGAAVFGHFGDRVGRKATLVTTLLLMGLATALIGVLPGHAAIGLAAPILLTVLRVVQGLGVGGEWGGSVLMAMEWGPGHRRGLMASWPQLGVPIGLLLSTGLMRVFTGLSADDFERWGWRVPFLLSLVLVAIGLYVRLRVAESPEFDQVRREESLEEHPVLAAFRRHPREIITSAFIRMSEQAPFYVFITFVLTYGTEELALQRDMLLNDTLAAAAMGLVTVPFFGWLSDLWGRRVVYGAGIIATAVYAFPYFGLLGTRQSGVVLAAIMVSLLVHDMQYGPQAALIAESFGTQVRYSGAGMGYQLASVIAGGPAPLIAAAILSATGSSTGISWYIVGCAAVSFVALLLLPRSGSAPSGGATAEAAPAEVSGAGSAQVGARPA